MASKEPASRGAFEIARIIDHTLLKPEAMAADIRRLCEEAKQFQFFSVCINPGFVSLAAEILSESAVKVCTVIGFPLGANETQVKSFEAKCAIQQGAHELDMVLNIGALKGQSLDLVSSDIRAVVEAAEGRPVKVILETNLLSDEEKVMACKLCVEAGAHFVKTSTGFSGGGATVEDVRLMRAVVGPKFGVKASGGIRSYEDALRLVQAGATRLGTSQGASILQNSQQQNGGDY